MSSSTAILRANLDALAAAQKGGVVSVSSENVQFIEGAWRLKSGDRHLAIHSRDPQRESDRDVADLLDTGATPTLIVAIGLALGFLLEGLDRRGWSGKVLGIEPEPETIGPFLSRRDWQSWIRGGRLRVIAAPDFIGASDCWPLFGDGSEEPAVFVNAALAGIRPASVERARALAERLRAEARANADARRQFGGSYLLNTLRNLPAISSEGDVAALSGAAAGMPAIVVAAGPSLDRALPVLRQAQHSALVITVDTALRPLLDAGITPSVVVGVDPSEANARHLTDLPPCPDTCLVAEGSLDSLALAGFAGRTFFFRVSDHQPWPWLRRQGHDVGTVRAWGSVLTSAFDLALAMGCDPIMFMGADLAYTDDRPYCRGVVYEEDWRRRSEWGEPLEQQWAQSIDRHPRITESDVAGRDTRTASHLLAFRNWLLEQMRRETGRRFLNATGGGILHGSGVAQIAFDHVPRVLANAPRVPADVVRRHHRPADGRRVMEAVGRVLADSRSGGPDGDTVLEEWERFAPGLSRPQLMEALSAAVTPARDCMAPVGRQHGAAHGRVHMAEFWLRPWAQSVPLVPMRMPPHRLERAPTGARIFRVRTMAARLISCALQPPDGGVAEDGLPLKSTNHLDDIAAGAYAICRDEIHFRATDESDPRSNGRLYTVLVPPCVAELEGLPFQEILSRHV